MFQPLITFSESETFNYQLFQGHGAIMLLIEPEGGKIVDANQSAVNFYGYSLEEFQNMTIEEINMLTPSQVEQERLAAEREDRNYFIFPHLLANGETKNVEVYSWPVSWQGQTPDLIFTDIKLPDIDGYQVAKTIHQLDGKVTIIALSAMAWPADKAEQDHVGIKEFIKKPFSESEIRRILKSFL